MRQSGKSCDEAPPRRYRSAATTGPKPISRARPCAARICSASSVPIRGRAATARRWTAALLSTTVTTRLLMRCTSPADSDEALCLRARSRSAASTGAQYCSCAGVSLSTLLIRGMLIAACASVPLDPAISRARACESAPGNKPIVASANTPAHRSFFILLNPQRCDWVWAGRVPGNLAPKAYEMRTKCYFVRLHGTKC